MRKKSRPSEKKVYTYDDYREISNRQRYDRYEDITRPDGQIGMKTRQRQKKKH